MSYVSANPYDLTVPKPLNRQTFIDRGIYQFDLFTSAGQAIRPQSISSQNLRYRSRYPITFLGSDARGDRVCMGAQRAEPQFIDSPQDYGGIKNGGGKVIAGHGIQRPLPAERDGEPFLFGAVHQGLMGDRCPDPYQEQKDFGGWVDLAHGHRGLVVGAEDRPAAPGRATAIRRFEANERCRQLVYWLVDWQRYQDAETAPSAPIDYAYLRRQQKSPFIYGKVGTYKARAGSDGVNLSIGFKGSGPTRYGFSPGDSITVGHDSLADPITCRLVGFSAGDDWHLAELDPGDLADFKLFKDSNAFLNVQRGSQDSDSEERWMERLLGGNPEIDFVWIDPERTGTPVIWEQDKAKRYEYTAAGERADETALAYFASGHSALPLTNLRIALEGQYWGKKIENNEVVKDPVTGKDVLELKTGYATRTVITTEKREMNPFLALGAFGADRDGNGRYEPSKHPVSPSTRMQATEICRFAFYDPIAWLSIGR